MTAPSKPRPNCSHCDGWGHTYRHTRGSNIKWRPTVPAKVECRMCKGTGLEKP